MSLARSLHTFKDGDVTVAMAIDGSQVLIGETRNEEHVAEGKIDTLRVVMDLAEAVAMAKAILAAAEESEDAYFDAQYQMRLDYEALREDCIEANYRFLAYQA